MWYPIISTKIHEYFEKNGAEKYIQHKDRMYAVTKNLKIWRNYGEKIPEELIDENKKLVKIVAIILKLINIIMS